MLYFLFFITRILRILSNRVSLDSLLVIGIAKIIKTSLKITLWKTHINLNRKVIKSNITL